MLSPNWWAKRARKIQWYGLKTFCWEWSSFIRCFDSSCSSCLACVTFCNELVVVPFRIHSHPEVVVGEYPVCRYSSPMSMGWVMVEHFHELSFHALRYKDCVNPFENGVSSSSSICTSAEDPVALCACLGMRWLASGLVSTHRMPVLVWACWQMHASFTCLCSIFVRKCSSSDALLCSSRYLRQGDEGS